MTTARRIVAGTTHLITRRCSRRTLLLVPDKVCWDSFLYCLARAAEKYGVIVHAAVMMGNHIHLLVTDSRGVLPQFMAWFIRQFARCIQKHRNWPWPVWENGTYSNQEICTEEAFWDALLYIFCNPIKAGLVHRLSEWKRGLITSKMIESGKVIAEKPPVLFGPSAPSKATLKLCAPDFLECGHKKFVRMIEEQLSAAIESAKASIKRFIGWKRVLQTNPQSQPRTKHQKFTMSPALKAVTGKALRLAIAELKAFRQAYKEAYEAFAAGEHNTVFPKGTWWMTQYGGACACS